MLLKKLCIILLSVGGQNVVQSTLNMTYENFLQQVNLAEQLVIDVETGIVAISFFKEPLNPLNHY